MPGRITMFGLYYTRNGRSLSKKMEQEKPKKWSNNKKWATEKVLLCAK